MLQKTVLGFALLVLTFIFASSAYAGQVQLTTYYPAPSGEYNQLKSNGACVGTGCTGTDVTNDNLVVKRSAASTGGDLTVEGKTHVGGAGSKGFVITQGTPTTPEVGQIWIQ